MNSLLHYSQAVRDKFGEKGLFPQSNESPTWQHIVFSGLTERGFKIVNWIPKSISVEKNGKTNTFDYSKQNSMNADKIFKYFEKRKFETGGIITDAVNFLNKKITLSDFGF